ncbi:MAG: DNA polymerase III subunit delta [Anaerovibrio sp.]|uniref:DNA polymerase III subunit delta n=1 Tax=Anaerovibrio sp. TaxID=1872532 RepID=UPI0025E2EBC8|nr:DNA polymerase III subunit delta [Anaerovibrio sp.]MCR5175356.1 DNA polymerase III subunit delta [Anaerovibrio sp.]
MNYGELRVRIKKGDIKQLYLLAGEEGYYIEKSEKAILAALFPNGYKDEDVQLADGSISCNDIIAMVETVPFFSPRNVIILRDADLFRASKKGSADGTEPEKKSSGKKGASPEERLAKLFSNMPDFSTVIFELHGKVDKRKRLYKELAAVGQVVEADPVKSYNIDEWLHGKLQEVHKNMDGEAHSYFVRAVGMMDPVPLGFLDKEMDKLALFMGAEQKNISRDILEKVFSDVPEIDGFAMNAAIGQHDIKKALFLFQKQQDKGVYIVVIIGQLVHYVRQMWQAKTFIKQGYSDKRLGQALGVFNSYVVKKIARECQGFSEEVLKDAFLRLSDIDLASKTGRCHPAEIEAVIISLCSGKQ